MKYNKKFEEKVGYVEINKVVKEFLSDPDKIPADLLYSVAVGLENLGYKIEAKKVLDLSNKI